MSRKYYTNGINEKRFLENDIIPDGWVPGRLKSTVTTLNKIWINNGIDEFFIDKNETIPSGFVKGRIHNQLSIDKRKETLKSKHYRHYNNGIKEILVSEKDEIPDGFVKGRLPMKDSQKKKLSESHIGLHHTNETREKISLHTNNNRDKAYKTNLQKYGVKNTLSVKSIHDKGEETKRLNGTFNTSKPEILYYNMLCEKYGRYNIKRNYKSDSYPFRCDFYIVPEDKYIELNLHWTHGGHPFDEADIADLNTVEIWKEKAKTSQFYANAIQTWTVRDVEKQKVAKENNLNYEVIYRL